MAPNNLYRTDNNDPLLIQPLSGYGKPWKQGGLSAGGATYIATTDMVSSVIVYQTSVPSVHFICI